MIWAAWAVASIALAGVGIAPDVFLVAICAAITYFGLTYGNLLWGTLMPQGHSPAPSGSARQCWSAQDCPPCHALSSSCPASGTQSGRTTPPCHSPATMSARWERPQG